MSPKRKACAEVSGNASQETYVPGPDSLPKRQRYQAKSRPGETVSLVQAAADESLTGELSGATTYGKQVSNGKVIMGKRRVNAKTLPGIPQFQPFSSPYPEHAAQVTLLDGCAHDPFSLFSLFFTPEIFEELAVNTNLYAFQKREMVAHGEEQLQQVN
ncbi:hypothetical protein HOY82DRAFT_542078 [Tuber indicum]|nr:hypothetical protein HOY82DRAFT_542078 [Tuber indicum]